MQAHLTRPQLQQTATKWPMLSLAAPIAIAIGALLFARRANAPTEPMPKRKASPFDIDLPPAP
jgi:hypothetical protein